jgi:hypothetical protein
LSFMLRGRHYVGVPEAIQGQGLPDTR